MTDETARTSETSDEAPKTKPSTTRQLEPDDVELKFTGDPDRLIRGVPATDLTQAAIDRLTYRRTIPEPGASGLRRGESGFSEARAKVVRELIASGNFTKRS